MIRTFVACSIRSILASGLLAASIAVPATAQDTVDIGVIHDEDITVVQKLLFPKDNRAEIGLHVGVMPFDAYLTTPNGQLSYTQHLSERFAIGLVVGGGWGFKTAVYRKLESPAFGVAPYAYRYLGSGLVGIEWSPIYAKLNWNGGRILHFDVYLALRAGATAESSVIPSGGITIGPTASPGIGGRFFIGRNTALKLEIRDDLLVEYRQLTQSVEFKQNANVSLGLAFLSKAKD